MFSKLSRYRSLPDEAGLDARGRRMEWKSLRLLPDAPGTFLHTVEEVDRLDHLAYKYYDQPRDWWRIADANPAFLSPQALLGKEPRATVRIPVTREGDDPPWSGLLRALRETPGVERAVPGTPERPYPDAAVVEGPPLFDIAPGLAVALDAGAPAQTLSAPVRLALIAGGVDLPAAVRMEKPDAVTWRVTAPATREVYTLRLFPADPSLQVFATGYLHAWVVEATFDTTALAALDLVAVAEGAGFAAGPPEEVGRVGKPIVVPPRRS